MPDDRLMQLDPAELTLLGTAAVCGHPFETRLLRALSPSGPSEVVPRTLVATLERMVERGILQRLSVRGDRYAFAEAALREAMLATLDLTERAELHARAAEALAQFHPLPDADELGIIATHYWLAGDWADCERAWNFAVRAGEAFAGDCCWTEASRFYEYATQLTDRLAGLLAPADLLRQQHRCWHRLGVLHFRSGELQKAHDAFGRAVDTSRAMARAGLPDAPERLAEAALGHSRVRVWVAMGNVDEPLVALLEEARAALGNTRPDLRARLLGRLAEERYFASRQEESCTYRDESSRAALELAREAGDPETMAAALNSRRIARWLPDNLAERATVSRDLVHLFDRMPDLDPDIEAQALMWWVHDQLEGSSRSNVDNVVPRIETLARRHRRELFEWQARTLRVMLALLDDHLEEAESVLAQAEALGARVCPVDAWVMGFVQRFALHREQGRLSELAAGLEHVARALPTLPVARAASCLLLAHAGRRDEAGRLLDEFAVEHFPDHFIPFDQNWPMTLALLGEAAVALDDRDRAAELFHLLAPLRNLTLVAAPALMVYAPVSEILAMLAAFLDRLDAADELFATAQRVSLSLRSRAMYERISRQRERCAKRPWSGSTLETEARGSTMAAPCPATRPTMHWTQHACAITWNGQRYAVSAGLDGMYYAAFAIARAERGIDVDEAHQMRHGPCLIVERALDPRPDAQSVRTELARLGQLRAEVEDYEARQYPVPAPIRHEIEAIEQHLKTRARPARDSRAVKQALRRAYAALCKEGADELATHLKNALKVSGGMLFYRPKGVALRWEIVLPNQRR